MAFDNQFELYEGKTFTYSSYGRLFGHMRPLAANMQGGTHSLSYIQTPHGMDVLSLNILPCCHISLPYITSFDIKVIHRRIQTTCITLSPLYKLSLLLHVSP